MDADWARREAARESNMSCMASAASASRERALCFSRPRSVPKRKPAALEGGRFAYANQLEAMIYPESVILHSV